MKTAPVDLSSLLNLAGSDTRAILEAARVKILEKHPDATEVVWVRQKIVSFGFGPKKMSDHYAYLQLNSRHVNLGFYHADALEDEEGILEGNGLKLRHIKLFSIDDVCMPSVERLLDRAKQERHFALRSG